METIKKSEGGAANASYFEFGNFDVYFRSAFLYYLAGSLRAWHGGIHSRFFYTKIHHFYLYKQTLSRVKLDGRKIHMKIGEFSHNFHHLRFV